MRIAAGGHITLARHELLRYLNKFRIKSKGSNSVVLIITLTAGGTRMNA